MLEERAPRFTMSQFQDEANEQHAKFNPVPQNAPGAKAAGHALANSIPLSIFPIQADKFLFCFCGLPGRGKTHIATRLLKYLKFFHAVPTNMYNVVEYRRKLYPGLKEAHWFDPSHAEGAAIRSTVNECVVAEVITFLNAHDNGIAILDSTNPTHARRSDLVKKIHTETGAKVMFIEVINEDVKFLENQYNVIANRSPEYAGMSASSSLADYRQRIENYQTYYEPLDSGDNHPVEKKWTYMKCDHSVHHFVVHKARGYLQQKVVNFIMNLRTTSHAFYLSRHGQSEYNDRGRIGGDSGLTDHGRAYAKALAEHVDTKIARDEHGNDVPARLWTSTMSRTIETTQYIKQFKMVVKPDADDPTQDFDWYQMRLRKWHHLDELFAGTCDGMTYKEIEEKFPEEWERRKNDKLAYRYPRGESYLDVIARLEPIIIEMERHQEPLLIVAHQGILRIILAFYMGYTRAEAPFLSIPLNTVVELRPGAVECIEKRVKLYSPAKPLTNDGQTEQHTPGGVDPDDPPSH